MNPEKGEILVNIHNSKSKNFKEQMGGVMEAFGELAKEVKNNPELTGISRVVAKSWIVEKHPKVIERYGFSLDGTDSASISKDDFIERFGNA